MIYRLYHIGKTHHSLVRSILKAYLIEPILKKKQIQGNKFSFQIPVGLAGVTVLIVLVIIGYCCYKRGDSKESRYAEGNQYP